MRYTLVTKLLHMIKNYSKHAVSKEFLTPSESTIQFLLDFSKSLNYVESPILENKIELNLN